MTSSHGSNHHTKCSHNFSIAISTTSPQYRLTSVNLYSSSSTAQSTSTIMTKTALITGITGQDGSYLTEFLLGKGYTVSYLFYMTISLYCLLIF